MAVIFLLYVPVCAFADDTVGVYNVILNNSTSPENVNTFSLIGGIDTVTQNSSSSNFDLEVSDITDSSVVISWRSEAVYLGYTICKYNVFTQEWEDFAYTSEQSYKVTGLFADTTYRFCVKGANTDEILGMAQATTITEKASIQIGTVTSESVEMSFNNVDKKAHIELYRSDDEQKDFTKIARFRAGRTYTDKDVEEGKTYYYRVKCLVRYHGSYIESEYSTVKEATTLVSMGLPKVSGKTKTYAYYTAVTVKSSPQYKLLNSKECYTDPETGIRMVDGCYCIALGSFYGSQIGTKYRITLSSGNSFDAILCDQKSNRHTDKNHQYAVRNKDIVEFYVEKGKIPSEVRGSYNALEQFKGKVVSIEKYV